MNPVVRDWLEGLARYCRYAQLLIRAVGLIIGLAMVALAVYGIEMVWLGIRGF